MPKLLKHTRWLVLGTFFAMTIVVRAQTAAQDPVQYIVAPETPGPNQTVTIEIQGVGTFLGDATITWSQDGVVTKKGAGERTYSFTTGALGKTTTVRATIASTIEGTVTKSFTFTPSLINIVWEADTTVPAMYRGKPLYSAGSPLKIVAFPYVYSGSSRIAASALSFQWSRGEDPVPEASGLGRSTFAFVGDQLQTSESVVLDVFYGNKKVAHNELTVSTVNPQLVLYQRDALRGTLYDSAMPDGISLMGKEITLQAEPYYFSNASKKSGTLGYTWELNGDEITGPDSARGILTLRAGGAGVGSADLSASLQNYDSASFVQNAATTLQIVFGQQAGSALGNLFGI